MEEETVKKVASEVKVLDMPSIDVLFSQSWDTFKKSTLSLFVFHLVGYAVLFALIFVAIVLIVLSGVVAVAAGNQQNFSVTGGLVLFGGIGFIIFLFFCIAWGVMIGIGDVFVVYAKGKIPLGETIRKSLPLILPTFLVSLVMFFFVMGGFFLFFIPGLVFSLFFAFATYEVILDNKRGSTALRLSMSIVSQHFWEIFGRLLLLGVIYFLIVIVFAIVGIGIALFKNSALYVLFYILEQVFYIVFTWFAIAYGLTMYQHAKAAAHNKQGSLLWPTIIAVMGWVLGVFLMISIGSLIGSKSFQEGFKKGFQDSGTSTQTNKSSSALSQLQADALAYDTFQLVNVYRKENTLPVLETDNRLCAYAQRRLEQLTASGRYDDGKGFFEDLANTSITNAYFTDYKTVGEASYGLKNTTEAKDIINAWKPQKTDKPDQDTMGGKTYTNGCVRANTTQLVLVAAADK